jgi:Beta-1,3-glucanase/Alpha-L-arabinofuranosidase B (ABFB) domain
MAYSRIGTLALLTILLAACGQHERPDGASGSVSAQASSVALTLNAYASLQVTTPGFTNRSLRHSNSLGFTAIVDATSDTPLKKDASWRIVRGLADATCHSLESLNFPGDYLRHSGSRVRKDRRDGSAGFDADATWCTQPGRSGTGVTFESKNFPGRYLRHFNAEVWLAQPGGPLPSDAAGSLAQDASWNVIAPWTTGGGDLLPPAPTGRINLRLLNATNGAYPSDQIYWAIIGYNPASNALSYVNRSGQLVNASPADNDGPNRVVKNGIGYANYFNRVSEAGVITLPKMYGARMFLSVGTPMFIKILGVPGGVGFAGPDINNPSDPNQDVPFDFTEFTFNDLGFFGNTTRVDQFGFPLRLRLVAFDGYDRTVGENSSRAQIFTDFENIQPTEFRGLVRRPYRIVAPAKGNFGPGRPNANYFDGYVNQVWDTYRNTDLVVGTQSGTYRGRAVGNDFVFAKNGGPANIFIRGKPTTQNVFEASGSLASGNSDELVIQAQFAAALNRHLIGTVDPSQWSDAGAYYRSGPANFYAKFWHDRSIDGLAYGFAYDDVREKSTLLQNPQPRQVDFTIGW